jgi:hypothetical protein
VLAHEDRHAFVSMMPEQWKHLAVPQREENWRLVRPKTIHRFFADCFVSPRTRECANESLSSEHGQLRSE